MEPNEEQNAEIDQNGEVVNEADVGEERMEGQQNSIGEENGTYVFSQVIVQNLNIQRIRQYYDNWKLYMKLQGLQNVRSFHSRTESRCRFINRTKQIVQILWVNEQGIPTKYGQLKHEEHLCIHSYVGHPWIVRNGYTGEVLLLDGQPVYYPKANPRASRIIVRPDVIITDPVLPLQELCAQMLLRKFAYSSQPEACIELIENLKIPKAIKDYLNTKILLNIIYRRNIGGHVGRGLIGQQNTENRHPDGFQGARIRIQRGPNPNGIGAGGGGGRRRARPASPPVQRNDDLQQGNGEADEQRPEARRRVDQQ